MNFRLILKRFFLFFIVFFIFNKIVFATDLVRDIRVEGTKNFNESVVRDKIKLKKKDKIKKEQIGEDIKAILETGYFDDVTSETKIISGGIAVIYRVVEKPMIKKILIEGNQNIKKSKIKDKIQLKIKGYYDEFSLNLAKQDILNFYKEQGYTDVALEASYYFDDKENSVEISFFISEGVLTKLDSFVISGNAEIKTKKIIAALGMKKKKVFKEDAYKKGLKNIVMLYRDKGYLDAEVTEKNRIFNEERSKIIVELEIKEGQKYSVGEINILGNKEFSREELFAKLTLKSNELFRQSLYEESIAALHNIYAERGYVRAEIKPEIIYKDKFVNVNFSIVENGIVYIDKIYIDGNNVTKDHVIRREIVIKEHEPFNVTKTRRSQERIFNLGFFRDINLDVDQVNNNTVDLIFKVEEKPTGMATIGAGYSSEDGVIGNLQISKANLFGRGQKLSFMWEFGKRKQNYQVSFFEPYLFGSFISFGTDLFDMTRSRDYVYTDDNGIRKTDVYTEKHQGAAIKFGRRFFDDYLVNVSYGFDRVKIYDVDDDTSVNHMPLVEEQKKGEQDTSSITTTFSRDTRDNVFFTRRGTYTRLSVKYAGGALGGNNNFVKGLFNHSRFYNVFWNFVLAFNLDAGKVDSFTPSKEVPIYERFYIGGSESVRGYDYRGDIGPQDGGLYKIVYNVEYKFPIVMDKKQVVLEGAIFYDVGGSWANGGDVDLRIGRGPNMMRSGVGVGIRFTTPAFPIRLDWGYGLNKEEGRDPAQFYFTIGQIF